MRGFMIKTSLILPTYNNIGCLYAGLFFLRSHQIFNDAREVIVVDDGSDRITKQKLTEIEQIFPIKLVTLPKNTGKGGAILAGLMQASGQNIIYTDADVPYSIDNLLEIEKRLEAKNVDCVIGDRTHNAHYFEKIPFLRKLASKSFNFLCDIVLGFKDLDNQCGLKGFKKEVLLNLFENAVTKRYAFDAELLFRALYFKYSIIKVNVELRYNGLSSVSVFRDGIQMFLDILKIRIFSLPLAKKINK